MGDDRKFGKAIAGTRMREVQAIRERVLRGEEHPGEFGEVFDLVHEVDGVPDKIFADVEIGAGWVMDAPEDHAAEN
jgi:hypothetical protein